MKTCNTRHQESQFIFLECTHIHITKFPPTNVNSITQMKWVDTGQNLHQYEKSHMKPMNITGNVDYIQN